MRDPAFTETLQIALVVRDLEASMRTYVHDYGVGPWEIYETGSRSRAARYSQSRSKRYEWRSGGPGADVSSQSTVLPFVS